jgi:hypothetical protein
MAVRQCDFKIGEGIDYYQCKAEGGFGPQKLDDYEEDLGFVPI